MGNEQFGSEINGIETVLYGKNVNDAIKWWESKRLVYNLITTTGGLLVILSWWGIGFSSFLIQRYLEFAYCLLGANMLYTGSWVCEIFLNHYFKLRFWLPELRWVIYVLGTIFSFFWMALLALSRI